MGYETKLYIGYTMTFDSKPTRFLTLKEDYQGIPRGSSFRICPAMEDRPEGLYLPDGNTFCPLSVLKVFANVEIHLEAIYHDFFTIAMIDMCKIGSVKSYLKESDILCHNVILSEDNKSPIFDLYGDELVVYKAKSMLQALRKMAKDDEDSGNSYWRWKLATHAISRVIDKSWQKPLGVISYGY